MTDHDPNDIQSALNVVSQLLGLLGDPATLQKLKLLQVEARKRVAAEEKATRQFEAIRGTCPTCGREYGINKDGTIRRHRDTRHGNERCQFYKQLPAEVIPAVLAIAQLGANRGEATSDDDTG